MSQQIFTVDQVAEMLSLHVRTVRRYIREGRLEATRIGKQYRIAQSAVEKLTGSPVGQIHRDRVAPHTPVDVSSIVELENISPEQAVRMSNYLISAANGDRRGDAPLRITTAYDAPRQRLKAVCIGGLKANIGLLKLVDVMLETENTGNGKGGR